MATCGLHHWLALERQVYNLVNFRSNLKGKVARFWAQSHQIYQKHDILSYPLIFEAAKSTCINMLTCRLLHWFALGQQFNLIIDFFVFFSLGSTKIQRPNQLKWQIKITFQHLLLESPKNFEGHINQKFYQIQLEHQKLFNLVANYLKIGLSEAAVQ